MTGTEMEPQTIVSLLAIPVAIIAAYVTARVSKKKEPEDREAIVTDTAKKVLEIVNEQLDKCIDANKSLEAKIAAQSKRISKLEKEVKRLGGDPLKINGGTES